jgi:hypothetical protein
VTLDPLGVALRVAEALEGVGAEYLVGGSLASSIAGEPRSTLDIDLVVRLTEAQVDGFVDRLGDEFYADRASIRRAIRDRTSANILHLDSAMKVDLFVLEPGPFEQGQMARRRRVEVRSPDGFLYVYSAEDIVIQKLRWYRLGNEVSERQWRDVLGVLRVSGTGLDRDYLLEGARTVGVEDLLVRALTEANLDG